MNEALTSALANWTTATADLNWGVQRVFYETLEACKDEKTHLVYGADYRDGKPCLLNTVAPMLTHSSSGITPSNFAPEVVRYFDQVNAFLADTGVNDTSGYVSPLAAEVLLRNFGELKPSEITVDTTPDSSHEVYIEPSDLDLARDLLEAMSAPAPGDVAELAEDGDAIAQHILGLQ